MAERPGWDRVSPGAVLAGQLPDQFAYRAHAGLSHPSHKPKVWCGCMMTASCVPSLCARTGAFPPVFLRSFVALAKFMRLSLVKAAHGRFQRSVQEIRGSRSPSGPSF